MGASPIKDFGSRLDPRDRAYQDDRPVEGAQGSPDLRGEIDVPRGIYEVDAQAVPLEADRRGLDCNPPFALDFQVVGDRRAVVYVARAPYPARDIEEPFRQAGLSRVDMGEDTDIAEASSRNVVHGRRKYTCYRRLRLPVKRLPRGSVN